MEKISMMRLTAQFKKLASNERAKHLALRVVILAALLSSSGVSSLQPHLASGSTLPLLKDGTPPPSIKNENRYPGTANWRIPAAAANSTQIQAYASATSISPRQTLTFYVSTQVSLLPYRVQVYRLGWYGGAGGRLMEVSKHLGQAQGYYDPTSEKLIHCTSCHVDPKTHLIEANWRPSFTLTIPTYWTTGVYEATFADAYGTQAAVSFVVRGNPLATYIVVIADNTTAAYNHWGGYSLYTGPDYKSQSRASAVSFDRPEPGWSYAGGNGLPYEIDAIRWMERQGYDLSYMSSVDLDEHPEQLLNHRAYISLGHDEYWSLAMRNGVENARNHGVGLLFFGADDAYWQIRYAPDSQGHPDRTIICYKNAQSDPLYNKDNVLVTVRWRDPPVNRPENALIGIMYRSNRTLPPGFPWQVSATASSPLLEGTGLMPGQSYGCDLVGNEWDAVFNNGATPPELTVLASSPVISYYQQKQISNTAYYIASSGALVFATGSSFWNEALDNLRMWDTSNAAQALQAHPCLGKSHAVPGMQHLMAHVMAALIVTHRARLALNLGQPLL
jgi:hypothetical protein